MNQLNIIKLSVAALPFDQSREKKALSAFVNISTDFLSISINTWMICIAKCNSNNSQNVNGWFAIGKMPQRFCEPVYVWYQMFLLTLTCAISAGTDTHKTSSLLHLNDNNIVFVFRLFQCKAKQKQHLFEIICRFFVFLTFLIFSSQIN